jgi:cell division protein FtsW
VQLASVAITVWLIGQATMNMGYVVGLLPVTGVTLPLISAGGTSLILTLFIVGLLARFACSEPAAAEHLRTAGRSRLARLLVPAPATAVERVRPRRQPEPDPRPSVAGSPRTLLHARGAGARRSPVRTEAPRGGVPTRAGGVPEAAAPARRDPARRARPGGGR